MSKQIDHWDDSARAAAALAGLLFVSGTAHFAAPGPFDSIVPHALPVDLRERGGRARRRHGRRRSGHA
jgi:hypothetical protein